MASARAGLGTAHIGPGLAGCWRGLPGVLSSAKAEPPNGGRQGQVWRSSARGRVPRSRRWHLDA
jgi:hypothetical protein